MAEAIKRKDQGGFVKSSALTIVLIASIAATFQTGQSRAQNHRSTPSTSAAPSGTTALPHAKWTEVWNLSVGLSENDFHKFGFDTLTQSQANDVLTWVLFSRPSLICGRSYRSSWKEDLKFLYVYVEAASSGASSFTGGLRSRLSSIQDLKLAYEDSDADLVISVLNIPTRIDNGREIGTEAAVHVMKPCTFKKGGGSGEVDSTFRQSIDSVLQAGPDNATVLSEISSWLDVRDFDDVRHEHTATLKALGE